MGIFVTVVIILAYFVATLWAAFKAIDREKLFCPHGVLAFMLIAIGLSILAYAFDIDEKKGPCLHYETQMYWNASVKSMMPARVCTQRAEWVEQ